MPQNILKEKRFTLAHGYTYLGPWSPGPKVGRNMAVGDGTGKLLTLWQSGRRRRSQGERQTDRQTDRLRKAEKEERIKPSFRSFLLSYDLLHPVGSHLLISNQFVC